jgi:hypothetical protein
MQNLNQSTWESDISYADISSKDKQLLLRLFFVKKNNVGQLKFKIHALFYGYNS